MSQVGNLSVGGAPVATGGANSGNRGLRQIAADFARRPLAMIGLVVLALAVLDTLLAPLLIGISAETPNIQQRFQGPSGSHPLGTDELGRNELARLLVAVHDSLLPAGAALVLAEVVGAILLAVVRLAERERGQQWLGWAEVVLTPGVGLLLLGGASLAVSGQFPSGIPSLFSAVFTNVWYVIRHPFSLLTEIREGAGFLAFAELLLIGELARLGYLLVARIRGVRASRVLPDASAIWPGWLDVVGPAIAVGLWIAADGLFVEPVLIFYGLGEPPPPTGSLSAMLSQAGDFFDQQPQLVLIPLATILVLYASLNLVGFGLRGVLRRGERGA